MDCLREACRQYREKHPGAPKFKYDRVPVGAQDDVYSCTDSMLALRRAQREAIAGELFPENAETSFVSIEGKSCVGNSLYSETHHIGGGRPALTYWVYIR